MFEGVRGLWGYGYDVLRHFQRTKFDKCLKIDIID
jgi:hypothetical protein